MVWFGFFSPYILFYRRKSNDAEIPLLCDGIAVILQEFNLQQKGCRSHGRVFTENIRGLISLDRAFLYSRVVVFF